MTSFKVSLYAASCSRSRSSSGRSGRSSRPPSTSPHQRMIAVLSSSRRRSSRPASRSATGRAAGGAPLPRRTTTPTHLHDPDPGAATTLVRTARAARDRRSSSSCRSSSSALARLGILTLGHAAPATAGSGYFIVAVIGVAACPASTRSRRSLETLPLLVLFELSIWLAVLARAPRHARDRSRRAAARDRRRLRRLGAPGRGPADPRRRASRSATTGGSSPSAPAAELGAASASTARVILPGFVNAHSHLEYAVYAGFGDGLPFAPWIGTHIERKARSTFDEMRGDRAPRRRRVPRASGITTVGDCSFSGAAATAAAELGLRAIVYLEVFGARRGGARARSTSSRERVAGALGPRAARRLAARARTPARSSSTRRAPRSGCRSATHLAESATSTSGSIDGSGPLAAFADVLVPPPGQHRRSAMLAEPACSGPSSVAAHCVDVDDEEIALLAAHGVAVAHCPRSNALLGCGIAPLARAARRGRPRRARDRQPRLDAVLRPVRGAAGGDRARRARASERPDALDAPRRRCELATLGCARALGLDDEVGLARARQAGRPDRRLACRTPVRCRGRSCCGRRLRRLAGRVRSYSRRRRDPLPARRRPSGKMLRSSREAARRSHAARSARAASAGVADARRRARTRCSSRGCGATRSGCSCFLALVFALGFVFFGVGSGATGDRRRAAGNFFRGSSGGGSSISALQKKTSSTRRTRQAWPTLATELEAEGQTDRGDPPLKQLHGAQPKDRRASRARGVDCGGRRPTRRSYRRRRRRRPGRLVASIAIGGLASGSKLGGHGRSPTRSAAARADEHLGRTTLTRRPRPRQAGRRH